MNREQVNVRDKFLLLTECSNLHKPCNIKRKTSASMKHQNSTKSSPKLSMQDFVRMDPSYTTDIEHLVFPYRKRNPQQVVPIRSVTSATAGLGDGGSKTRSRLAEMFALSKHLQQRSTDRESKLRNPAVNRSVDSVLDTRKPALKQQQQQQSALGDTARRWQTQTTTATAAAAAAEEPVVRQNSTSRSSSSAAVLDAAMSSARGPNVSVLQLRASCDPWDPNPSSMFSTTTIDRPCSTNRNSTPRILTKHQSLGANSTTKWGTYSGFHSGEEVNSTDLFLTSAGGCHHRELSPVRWCDREVDGVYLGRSGWVQVQQRSLDENRRVASLQSSRRTGIKLAHYNSEPGKFPEPQRPLYLSLQTSNKGFVMEKSKTPSPRTIPESFSPPSVTPIISPPPAFQDKTDRNNPPRTRTFFGKAPFLPRSNAIEDSDASPPTSPLVDGRKRIELSAASPPPGRKPKMLSSPVVEQQQPLLLRRLPQTKSLENTSSRRTQFTQRYGDSSSSSSSSMGFRSLDSCVTRTHMPRLSENTDSSVDVYEDADDEDNNSSSLNMSMVVNLEKKLSPSARVGNRAVPHHRRRSPAGSDSNRQSKNNSPTSTSSSSSCELPLPPPSQPQQQQQIRRPTPVRPTTIKTTSVDDARVRRSRSLQLPAGGGGGVRVSPQPMIKKRSHQEQEELLNREAEIVTEYLYGSRTRAAAQAQMIHNKYNGAREKKLAEGKASNGYGGVLCQRNKERQKLLQRGSTTPNLSSTRGLGVKTATTTCTSETCDFWPQCTHRTTITGQTQSAMRLSQSYPSHQRSLDSTDYKYPSTKKPSPSPSGYPHDPDLSRKLDRRPSPNRGHRLGLDASSGDLKAPSPVHLKRATSSNSSSSSDVWLTTSERTVTKSPRGRGGGSSGMSTPLDEVAALVVPREIILTRPGSAPGQQQQLEVDSVNVLLEAQQRSLSLPKSFLSPGNYNTLSGQISWKRQGTESLRSSPDVRRKSPETLHTAPVTPSHEGSRRHSPISSSTRRTKATSTPQLLEPPQSNKKWIERQREVEEIELNPATITKDCEVNGRNVNQEGVLQKFRKTFSLRFYKKSSKESGSSDLGETLSEILGEPAEEEDSPLAEAAPATMSTSITSHDTAKEDDATEQKHRFGALIWRTSKERKKVNKAARSAKCNSGDSGIQIEMTTSACGSSGGGGGGSGGAAGGDSSESHDTDAAGDEFDSPAAIRRRPPLGKAPCSRPHSDLLNQILIDKFKAELKSRQKHYQVRRTHSDLGGQRLLQWDPRTTYRRLMSTPTRTRPRSPQRKPPDVPEGVQLRGVPRCGQLRRSLSQPLDIDKLSPLMRTKTAGLRMGGTTVLSEDEHDGRGTSEDEMMMSDSESSLVSLGERKKSLELAMDEDVIILAEAVFDHVAIESEELAFRAGDVIEVLETVNRDWWWGSANGKTGWFPAAFVRLRVSQEDTVEDCLEAMASGRSVPSHLRRRTSISLLSNDQVRTSVVRELVHTERDFVKVLQDVAEGYVAECRKRKDMFSKEQIEAIFGNLEEILRFQAGFLKDLEGCIDWDAPYKSCVGACFLKHRAGFKMYSDYCNSHPVATATLQELYQFNNYSKFFEACRLMRGLIEIPLDGYLLTPVQRICKYPLQLAELLKYTKVEHADHAGIKEALEAMRDVAVLINERKRRMESLEKLAAWQQRVEGWEGEDLIETSSQLIYHGEVVRVTTGMWTTNIMLFLFDHQVVYCKKDILKRSTYVYKGRICLDTSEVIDVPDGKDLHIGVTVRHAIKLYSCVKDKWLLFCCRSSSEKQKWLQAFAEERKLVAQDKNEGLEFPAAAKQLARVAARCQRRPPRKPRMGKNYKHSGAPYMGSTLQLNTGSHHNSNSLGRKMGTWFMFGGNRKSRHRHRELS